MRLKLSLVSILSMCGLLPNTASPESFADYHFLSDNHAESKKYEIRKILGTVVGKTNAKIFRINQTDNYLVIAQASYEYGNDFDLWKINSKGYIVDFLNIETELDKTGIVFEKGYFIDWVYTGNKNRQKYAKTGSPNGTSDQYPTGVKKFNGLTELTKTEAVFGSLNETNKQLYISKYERFLRNKKSFLDLNNHSWSGSSGLGLLHLNYDEEQISFKSSCIKYDDGQYDPRISLFMFPANNNAQTDLMFLELRTRSMDTREESEIGLYVVRPRIQAGSDATAIASEKNSASAFSKTYQKLYQWKPEFMGWQPEKMQLRKISYFNGGEEFSENDNQRKAKDLVRAIPRILSIYWAEPRLTKSELYLYLNGNVYAWWESTSKGVLLQLHFDQEEVTNAFNQLGRKDQPVQLEVNMENAVGVGKILSVGLRNGGTHIPLKKSIVKSTGFTYGFDETQLIKKFEESRLK